MSSAPQDLLLCRIEDRGDSGRIAWLTVNNPARRNALGMTGAWTLLNHVVCGGFDSPNYLLIYDERGRPRW